jgi:XRE family transcriptional regulator, aerobic/anaerobic benzoate catabolism transcriptional regulator
VAHYTALVKNAGTATTPRKPPKPRSEKSPFLVGLGEAVRAERVIRNLTLRELALRANVSVRFLVQLEGGAGNISIARLGDVARALGVSLSHLLREAESWQPKGQEPRRLLPVTSLLGLRGAGKSTIGARVAAELGVPFVELDQLIAREAGMALSTIFEMHGDEYFRKLEERTLLRFFESGARAVLATGGSIVMHPASYALLRERTLTVWLKASPREHWDRVVAQGDARPMKGRPAAMNELRRLLNERTPLYSQASTVIDTSHFTVEGAVDAVVRTASGFMERGT